MFHAVPVIYKGSGFYTTDYGRPKAPVENGSKETKDSKDSSDSKSPKATEAKSESTAKTTSDSKS